MVITLRVGELAEQKGLNVKELAERAGVAYGTAHALVKGHVTRIDLETLDRICVALEVTPGDVLVQQPTAAR